MIRIDSLGALIRYRYDLSVHCQVRDCWNRACVDLEALAQRLGRDHGCLARDLKRYFRCSKCGSKEVGFSLSSADSSGIVPPSIGPSREVRPTERPDTSPRRKRRRR